MSNPTHATPPQIQGGEGSNSSDRFVWEKFPQLPSIGDPGADDRPVPRGHLDSLDVTHFEGADGSAGQVLETDGTNVAWVDKDASEFSGSAGSQGQVLTTDGSSASWQDAPEGIPLGTNTGELNFENLGAVLGNTVSGGNYTITAQSHVYKTMVVSIQGHGDDDNWDSPIFDGFNFDGSGNIESFNIRFSSKGGGSESATSAQIFGVIA